MSKSIELRIMEWNRERNGLHFDPLLETRLLVEEANEFMTATTTADRLREAADFLFVAVGTQAKFIANKPTHPDHLINDYERYKQLVAWAESVKEYMVGILEDEHITESKIMQALGIVTAANELKGKELDAGGKVTKCGAYSDPIGMIRALVGER